PTTRVWETTPASPRSRSRFQKSWAEQTPFQTRSNYQEKQGSPMTTTTPASKKPVTRKAPAKKAVVPAKPVAPAAIGRVARVNGPVVDIEFAHDEIPGIYNALKSTITIAGESHEITLEVAQHLGDDLVRAIALNPTDGVVRGQEVR